MQNRYAKPKGATQPAGGVIRHYPKARVFLLSCLSPSRASVLKSGNFPDFVAGDLSQPDKG